MSINQSVLAYSDSEINNYIAKVQHNTLKEIQQCFALGNEIVILTNWATVEFE